MLKQIKIGKLAIIVFVIAVLSVFAVKAAFAFGENYVNIKGQHLKRYACSSGGDMRGGFFRETIKRYDDKHAIMSVEKAEWHYQDPEVAEYLLDIAVMDELENIIRKEKMNYWNRKEFTDMFVADGASESYSFDFDKDFISFSSQIYPQKYRDKLKKLDEVIKKYRENGEKLPGLVRAEQSDENAYELPENETEVSVYYYCGKEIGIKIRNGKDKEYEIPYSYKIVNAETDQVIAEKTAGYSSTVYPNSQDKMDFQLDARLDAGSYKLFAGDWEIPFEIR